MIKSVIILYFNTLKNLDYKLHYTIKKMWPGGRVVMQRIANPCTSVQLRSGPPYFIYIIFKILKFKSPLGTDIVTLSLIFFPIKPFPIGELYEILFFNESESSSPTIV